MPDVIAQCAQLERPRPVFAKHTVGNACRDLHVNWLGAVVNGECPQSAQKVDGARDRDRTAVQDGGGPVGAGERDVGLKLEHPGVCDG